jgi:hypothetical protein
MHKPPSYFRKVKINSLNLNRQLSFKGYDKVCGYIHWEKMVSITISASMYGK